MVPGETAEACALKETKEELGIRIYRLESLGTFWLEGRDQLIHLFAGYVKETQFNLSPEIKEAHWIPVSEIESHLGPYSPKNLLSLTIRNYLSNLKK